MLRRIQIEPDDICRLALEIGVRAGPVPLQAMWLQASAGPDALHRGFAQPQSLRHLAARPVRAAIGRGLLQFLQHPRLHGRRGHARPAPTMTRNQAVNPLLVEAQLPARDGRRACAQIAGNRLVAVTCGQRQDQSRPENVPGRKGSRVCDLHQLSSIFGRKLQPLLGHVSLDAHSYTYVVSGTAH